MSAEAKEDDDKLREYGLRVGTEEPGDPADGDEGDPDDGDEDAEGNNKTDDAKLASLDLRNQIRSERAAGATYNSLARKYGVGRTSVTQMLEGKTYKRDHRG